MTVVGAVDLGTNSTRLLVADVDDGSVRALDRRLAITRLGEGVDARRRLLPVPIARVRNVLAEFRRAAEAHGAERVLLVATSAVRDAENGEAFLGEIEWSYGFATRLLSGDEEAELTVRGVSVGRTLDPATVVVDVGGGSTELVLADGGFRASLDVGCVRMTERFGDDVPALRREVARVLAGRVPDGVAARVTGAVGVAGTVTTLATIDLGLAAEDPDLVHGHLIGVDHVEAQLARLAGLPPDERRRVPGLDPERAPVIVAGVAIVAEVLRRFGLDELEASERDLLDGAALAAADLPAPLEGAAPPGAYTCC
ncbi:MAG TPA: Ppx/GppA phosphatase family protein [Gaiellaceae bacterium]|nr:Ppx/GppA phosphatase family protein [Gaiellaceae bacterium]